MQVEKDIFGRSLQLAGSQLPLIFVCKNKEKRENVCLCVCVCGSGLDKLVRMLFISLKQKPHTRASGVAADAVVPTKAGWTEAQQ